MKLTFELSLIQLNKIAEFININYNIDSNVFNKKVGLYKIFKNLISSLNTLKKLNEQNSETQSFATISRMIFDNYSVFFILSSYSTKDEQLLRYFLYLIDSLEGRINSITAFAETVKNNRLIESFEESKGIIEHDKKAISQILNKIHSENLNNLVSQKTIEKCNWKFTTKPNSKERLSWEDLYNISKVPKRYSKIIQNHYSTFTHGLGMTILYEQRNKSFIESTLLLLATIQLNIAKIIITELNINEEKLEMEPEFYLLMNYNWNNSERWNQ